MKSNLVLEDYVILICVAIVGGIIYWLGATDIAWLIWVIGLGYLIIYSLFEN